MAYIVMMKQSKKSTLNIPLALALILLCIGRVALINQWRFGSLLYLTALVFIGVLYGIRSSLKSNQNKKETYKMLSVLLFVIVELSGNIGFNYTYILAYLSMLIGLIWITKEIIEKVNGDHSSEQPNPILWIGIILMIIYVIIRFMAMPFGNIVIIIGLLTSALGFIVESLLSRKQNINIHT